jgi:hypothetical protein
MDRTCGMYIVEKRYIQGFDGEPTWKEITWNV